jgi:hypothetical protein
MRRLPSGIALLSVCVIAAFPGVAPAASAQHRADPGIQALVLGTATSPALTALRSVADLDTTRSAEVDRLQPGRYDMLLVDGDQLTADELRRRAVLESFVAAGKWIAAFDVRPADHEALRTYTGFDIADNERNDRSEMFVFRVSKLEGTPTVEMINSGPYVQPATAPLGPRRQAELTQAHLRRVARLVDGQLAVEGGSTSKVGRATAAGPQKLSCPPIRPAPDPELQHVSFCYVDTGLRPTPWPFWTRGEWQGWMDSFGAPAQQTSTWTMNHRFDVFLENDAARPQGDFQTVSYALNGQFAPAIDQRFSRMTDYITTGWDNCTCTIKFIPERAWWTGQIEPRVSPATNDAKPATTNPAAEAVPSTSERLLWQATHPDSANAQTNYSSGEEWSFNFTGSGTLGNLQNVGNVSAGLGFTYTSSNTKNYTIDDWGVENKGVGNEFHWLFSARNPCDTRTAGPHEAGCFVKGHDTTGGYLYPELPPPLSRGQVQVNASGQWRTQQHLSGRDGLLTFRLATPVRIVDTYCTAQFANWCWTANSTNYRTALTGPDADDVTIDASLVNPIPIKELKLTPSPANGAENEKVTGTVVLERAAAIPVTVKLFSNSGNAVLPTPLPGVNGGSQGAVTIDPGKTNATFTLATNDNKLSAGGRTTANITASYVVATDKQLVVERR